MNVNTYGISLWMEWSEDEEREMEREWIATWLPYIQFNTSAHFHSPSSLSFYFLILFFLDRNSRYDFFSSLLLSFACIDGIALRQRNDEACILAFVMYRDSLIELIEEYDIDFVPHAPCKHILFHSPMVADVPRILFVYTFTTLDVCKFINGRLWLLSCRIPIVFLAHNK